MTVHDLNRNQLIQLKQNYLDSSSNDTSWAVYADADNIVPDFIIFERYKGVFFVEDDFFS